MTGQLILYTMSTAVLIKVLGFPDSSVGQESACNAGDLGSILGLGKSPGGENDNPLQYSCLENPMDRGDCQAIVQGAAKSRARLSDTHPIGSIEELLELPAMSS